MLALKPELIGKDPLEIDAIYTGLGQRTDGSAHALMRGVSGIEMALWDLAGKILGVPATTLLGGTVPRPRAESTIMRRRATCSIRHRAASGPTR